MRTRNWNFPIVLKPDVGERGASVRLIHTLTQAVDYFAQHRGDVLAQPFHPGPFEAGIFYYRLPGADVGHIFSITDKVFSKIVGDGVSTLEQLIWRHPRFRMQAATFLKRHAAHRERVLEAGETFSLAIAGNHCQGTMFREGRQLITPALAERVDSIARSVDGFFIGRFDVRYADRDRFMAGEDLAIVELNGVTAESSNIYDPNGSLIRAYRTMFKQWRITFRIAHENIRRGHRPATHLQLLRATLGYLRRETVDSLAD